MLSFESQVIIMDEPTDALTDTETLSLFRVIGSAESASEMLMVMRPSSWPVSTGTATP